MSSKVSSGKNHDHSDSKPAGGHAGNTKSGTQGSKNSTGSGSQQSGSKGSGTDTRSSESKAGKDKQ